MVFITFHKPCAGLCYSELPAGDIICKIGNKAIAYRQRRAIKASVSGLSLFLYAERT